MFVFFFSIRRRSLRRRFFFENKITNKNERTISRRGWIIDVHFDRARLKNKKVIGRRGRWQGWLIWALLFPPRARRPPRATELRYFYIAYETTILCVYNGPKQKKLVRHRCAGAAQYFASVYDARRFRRRRSPGSPFCPGPGLPRADEESRPFPPVRRRLRLEWP